MESPYQSLPLRPTVDTFDRRYNFLPEEQTHERCRGDETKTGLRGCGRTGKRGWRLCFCVDPKIGFPSMPVGGRLSPNRTRCGRPCGWDREHAIDSVPSCRSEAVVGFLICWLGWFTVNRLTVMPL